MFISGVLIIKPYVEQAIKLPQPATRLIVAKGLFY